MADGYVIEMKHRITGVKKYIGSVPVESEDDVETFENTFFDSYYEASCYPYPSEEVAVTGGLSGLPKTKNISYSVLPTASGPDDLQHFDKTVH